MFYILRMLHLQVRNPYILPIAPLNRQLHGVAPDFGERSSEQYEQRTDGVSGCFSCSLGADMMSSLDTLFSMSD